MIGCSARRSDTLSTHASLALTRLARTPSYRKWGRALQGLANQNGAFELTRMTLVQNGQSKCCTGTVILHLLKCIIIRDLFVSNRPTHISCSFKDVFCWMSCRNEMVTLCTLRFSVYLLRFVSVSSR